MLRRMRPEGGLAMMSVIVMIFVLVIVGALVLYLTGKEIALSAFRLYGARAMNIAEGGAVSARSGLMAFMNVDPAGEARIDPSLSGTALANWYAGGVADAQNSLGLLDFIVVNNQRLTFGATAATNAVTAAVNWGLATPHLKLVVASGSPPVNPLGTGSYTATIVVTRRFGAHPTDPSQPLRYIQRLGADHYEFYYTYAITSDGQVSPQSRRRVTLARDFSIQVQRRSFAEFSLYTHDHRTPTGSAIWFTSNTSFDGPVHTNGEFRFAFFPKFGTPDPNTPCDPARIVSTTLTSAGCTNSGCTNTDRDYAWFNNLGSSVRLRATENVVGGVRRDAPVMPDCTPTNVTDDNDNPAANFTRAAPVISMPTNPYRQQGVSIGRDPDDTSSITNRQVREAVPELADNSSSVPTGIYVPVTDSDGNCRSDANEPMRGGIYVQGNLTSLTLSVGGPTNNLAVYTLVQGSRTVTVTVDRANNRTTVQDTSWPPPATGSGSGCPSGVATGPASRTFVGVPKGWQGPGSANATIIFVNGTISALRGTLEEKEQATIAAAGRIDIDNHLRYEVPPVVTDPTSNPLNVLGVYSTDEIRITSSAPNNLEIHAILMAGILGDSINSSVNVENYSSGSPRGTVRLIGGIIEEYYGPFGTFSSSTGSLQTGYGRDYRYDRRMGRGFTPPYFPTTPLFEIVGQQGLAGAKPVWREATP